MKKILVKTLSSIFFFYSRKKRKQFRMKYSDTAFFCRKLARKELSGKTPILIPPVLYVTVIPGLGNFVLSEKMCSLELPFIRWTICQHRRWGIWIFPR